MTSNFTLILAREQVEALFDVLDANSDECRDLWRQVVKQQAGLPLKKALLIDDLGNQDWLPVIDADLNLTGDLDDSDSSGNWAYYGDYGLPEAVIDADDAQRAGWTIRKDLAWPPCEDEMWSRINGAYEEDGLVE